MLGTLGRLIKVFDNKSREGDVILLAESLLEPSIALQEYITREPIDPLTARATFSASTKPVNLYGLKAVTGPMK